ncbi:hypothetical protein PybrP1_001945 [[Pythium] brassicae (nom. inval.)]|nr:hypothetical protein PybrP1_001945 [[Pythium] brassicae (nom. inval.)]
MFKQLSLLESLKRGSSNANFTTDFGGASLPAISAAPGTYSDVLDALHGIEEFARATWFPHARKMLDRVHNFVSANKSADPVESPERVQLTLMMANRFIGDALAALPGQDSLWWRNYWRAVDLIKLDTPAWAILLASARSSPSQPNAGPHHERAPSVSS